MLIVDRLSGIAAPNRSGIRLFPFRLKPIWLVLPGLLFLIAFLVIPTLRLLATSFEDADTGSFSLAAYQRAFGVPIYLRIVGSTFGIAFQTSLYCLLLGYPLAYWIASLPVRKRQIVAMLILLPFWVSALVKNFAWLILLGRTGVVSTVLDWFGYPGPANFLFGRGVVIFAMTHSMLPLATVSMLSVMTQIDGRLTQAAATLGAKPAEGFWRIYFPLSVPGVAAAGLLTFIGSLGYFITPALLGSPRETMIGQTIIQQVQQLDNMIFAAALAMILIVSAGLVCLVYDRIFGLATVAGGESVKRGARSLTRRAGIRIVDAIADICLRITNMAGGILGGYRSGWVLPTFALSLIALLVLPVIALVPMAFTNTDFIAFPPQAFGVRWFETYFLSSAWIGATTRSLMIALATGLCTLVLTTLAAFGLARGPSRFSGVIFLIFMAPMIVPSIVVAVALFYTFADIELIGTNLGIMLGHTVHAMPIAFVILLATLKAYDWRLGQAAATLGARPFRSFTRVTVPMIQGGLAVAFILAFLTSFEELTVAIFIGGGVRVTLPKQMWDDILLQATPILLSASVVVIVVVTSLFLFAQSVRGSRDT